MSFSPPFTSSLILMPRKKATDGIIGSLAVFRNSKRIFEIIFHCTKSQAAFESSDLTEKNLGTVHNPALGEMWCNVKCMEPRLSRVKHFQNFQLSC